MIPNYRRFPVCLVRGEGSWVWDAEGNRYLDFFPGLGLQPAGPLPAAGRRGGSRAGRPADPRAQYLVHGAPGRAGPGTRRSGRSAARASSATAAPRPTRPPSSWRGPTATSKGRYQDRDDGGGLSRPDLRRAHGHRPAQVPRRVRADGARLRLRSLQRPRRPSPRRSTTRRPRSWSSRSRGRGGSTSRRPDYLAGLRQTLRRARRALDPRRGADRHGPHRASGSPTSITESSRTS